MEYPEHDALAENEQSPVAPEAAADEQVQSATADAEDTQETPKRGGPRYKDLYAQSQKQLADIQAEMARRDEQTQKQLAEATQALNALLAREQKADSDRSLALIYRDIDNEAQARADRYGWDDYQKQEWANERKQLAQEKAQIEADKKLAKAQQEQAKLTEAQSNALKARPREVGILIQQAVKDFAEDNETDPRAFKLDPAQVIVALTKDPWENGAIEEAQRVITRMLNKQRRELESKGRQDTLADRAKNGTDVMPAGGSSALSWQQAWKLYADDKIDTDAFTKAMANAPIDAKRKAGLAL